MSSLDLRTKARRNLVMILLSTFIARVGFGELTLILSYHLGTLNVPTSLSGVAMASNPAAELITAIPAGYLSDKFGRKKAIVLGLLGVSFAFAMLSTAKSWTSFALFACILGVGEAFTISPALALLSESVDSVRLGVSMGLFDLSVTLGYIAGPVLGGVLYGRYGIGVPFLVASSVILVVALLDLFLISDVRYGKGMKRDLRTAGMPRNIVPLTLIWVIAMFVLSIGQLIIPRYAEEVGVSSRETGILLGAVGLVLMISYVLFGRISDKVGRALPMVTGLCIAALGIGLLAVFLSWNTMRILLPVIAVGGGAFAPAGMAILSEVAPEDLRGTTMGIYDFSISIGMILGPLYGGIVKDLFGYRVLFLSCSLLVSIALLVLTAFIRKEP